MDPIFIILIVAGCFIGSYLLYSYSICIYERYIRQ